MAVVEYPPDGSEVIVQLLGRPDKKEIIDKALGEAFGGGVRLRAVVQGASQRESAAGQSRRALDKIYEAFPRDKIEIVDEQNN